MKFELSPPNPGGRMPEEEFRIIFSRANVFCLDLVVVHEGKILLSKREIDPFKGFWVLPGGVVLFKEPIDQAFDRLVQKELGVICTQKEDIGIIQHLYDGSWRSTISLAVLVKRYSGQLRGCDEGKELKFFSPTEINYDVQPYQAEFLRDNFSRIVAMQG